jgi:hypothetical protein
VKRAADHRSPFSGRRAEHLHHMTGTDADGAYFDPRLLLPLTLTEHVRTHQSWGSAWREGVNGNAEVLRLRRSSNELIRLGERHVGGVVVLPAETVLELGRMQRDIADHLEDR